MKKGAVADDTRNPTPGDTTCVSRATARGAKHAMQGGEAAHSSSELRTTHRPETLRVRVWLREVKNEL